MQKLYGVWGVAQEDFEISYFEIDFGGIFTYKK